MDDLEQKATEALVTEDPQTNDDSSLEWLSTEELSTIERYKQQMKGDKADAERFKNIAIEAWYKAASNDADTLLELHKQDPKLAKEVANRFDFASSKRWTYENFLQWKESTTKKTYTEDEIEKVVEEREIKKEHEKAINKASKSIAKLDEEERESAQKYFDKITKWHTLDTESVEEFIDMATLYVRKDKVNEKKFNEAKEEFHSTSVSKSQKANSDDSSWEYIKNGRLYNSNK